MKQMRVTRQPDVTNPRPAVAAAVLAALCLVAAGCGGSSKATPPPSSSPVTATNSNSGSTRAESSPPAASIDFNATADCLDQFAGSGAQRGSADGAQTASTPVPKDSGWDTFLSVIVYVFPNPSAAQKFAKSEDPTETFVTGNAVVNGSAVADPYSKQLVMKCLKP